MIFRILSRSKLTNVKSSSNRLSSLGIFSNDSINLFGNKASRSVSAFRTSTYMTGEIRVGRGFHLVNLIRRLSQSEELMRSCYKVRRKIVGLSEVNKLGA